MIVLISGKRLSGKDTLALLVQNVLGEDKCQIISLADALKTEYCRSRDIDIKRIYEDPIYKEQHRQDLIDWGAFRRAENIDYWCEKLVENISRPIVLIPDLRFKNELNFFRNNSSCVAVRLVVNEQTRKVRGWNNSPADVDATETEMDSWDNWDYVIENNGSVDHLSEVASSLLRRLSKEIKK